MIELQQTAPICFIGAGATLNEATHKGLQGAAKLLSLLVEEVRNRATMAGAIETARLSGVVQIILLVPLTLLDAIGLGEYARG
jgi:formamidase